MRLAQKVARALRGGSLVTRTASDLGRPGGMNVDTPVAAAFFEALWQRFGAYIRTDICIEDESDVAATRGWGVDGGWVCDGA